MFAIFNYDIAICPLTCQQVIILAFLMQVNGRGGAPMYDFSVTSKPCPVFSGTDLKNCPSIG